MTDSQSPLDSETKQILSDLKSIFDRLQVPMLLIGARARLCRETWRKKPGMRHLIQLSSAFKPFRWG